MVTSSEGFNKFKYFTLPFVSHQFDKYPVELEGLWEKMSVYFSNFTIAFICLIGFLAYLISFSWSNKFV